MSRLLNESWIEGLPDNIADYFGRLQAGPQRKGAEGNQRPFQCLGGVQGQDHDPLRGQPEAAAAGDGDPVRQG